MSDYSRLVDALGTVYGRYVNGESYSGETPEIPVQSDIEAYLYALAGFDVEAPAPTTELGMALASFVEHADEIGGGGDGTIDVNIIATGSGEATIGWKAGGLLSGDDGEILNAAVYDGSNYLIDMAQPATVTAGETVTVKVILAPDRTFQMGFTTGTVQSATGAAEYDAEASTQAGLPIYIVSGACSFTVEGTK